MRKPFNLLFGLFPCLWLVACTPTNPHATTTATLTATGLVADTGMGGTAYPSPTQTSAIPLRCSSSVLRPAIFREEKISVLIYDGSPTYRNIPAETQVNAITLQVEPARFPVETVPAEYREVTETIQLERERSELYAVPATYRTVVRDVLVRPAHTRWKTGCTDDDSALCMENVPAEYAKIKTEMVATPAHTEQRRTPAKTAQVKRKILVKPGQGTGTPIPARYETLNLSFVTRTWRIETTPVPSRHETVITYRKLRDERVLAQATLCADADPALLQQVQRQLQAQGYASPTSGKLDKPTLAALRQFQLDKGLLVGGITMETLRKLGLA